MTVDVLARSPRPSVMVVGDVMLDLYWHGTSCRLSPEAPVPVVEAVREEWRPGGAANVAVQLAALGWDVSVHGVVGADEAADVLSGLLSSAGVRPALVRDDSRPTTVKQRILAEGSQLVRVDRGSSLPLDAGVEAALVDSFRTRRPRVTVLSDYAKGVLTPRLIAAAARFGAPVVVDTKRQDLARFRGAASVLTSNESEVRRATRADSLSAALRAARAVLPTAAFLVTRGEHGMLLDEPGRPVVSVPSAVSSVVDVTGAGDIVTAYVAHGLADGRTLAMSARLANAAAGVGVRQLGTATVDLEAARAALAVVPDWTELPEPTLGERQRVPA